MTALRNCQHCGMSPTQFSDNLPEIEGGLVARMWTVCFSPGCSFSVIVEGERTISRPDDKSNDTARAQADAEWNSRADRMTRTAASAPADRC